MLSRLLWKLALLVLTGTVFAGGVGLVAGRANDTPLLTVTVNIPPIGNLGVFMVDVERGLRLAMPLPVAGVRDIILSPDGTRGLLIAGGVLPRLHIYEFHSGNIYSTGTTHDLIPNRRPQWSPDSQKVVFYESFIPDEGDQGIHIMDFETRTTTQVFGSVVQAYWSPDGSRIAFTSNGDVFVADSTATRNVSDNTLWHYNTRWLDDETLVFAGLDFGDNLQRFFAMNPDADTPPQIISDDFTVEDDTPIITTAARQVLFETADGLHVADLNTGTTELVADVDDPAFDADTRLVGGEWTPDGAYLLAYTASAEDIPTVHIATWIRTGESWRRFFVESLIRSWSPDSEHVMYTVQNDSNGAYDVMLMDVVAGESRQLPGIASQVHPAWSADGRYLAYVLRENVPNGQRFASFTSRLYLTKMTGEGQFLTGLDDYVMGVAFQD